jgi:phage shock protein PspC (stress-responsive transcriptional regulator)
MARKPTGPLSRSEAGRWLGGVCAGLARGLGIHPAWIRAAFIVLTPLGGLGALGYLACWLIIPQEGEQAGELGPSWIVTLARACAVCIGVATLGAAGAAATLFGLGWLVAALAALVLLGVLGCWPRLGPGWALLPIAALTLPSIAVAAGGLTLSPDIGHVSVSPSALSATAPVTVRGGLGTMLVDLRRTALPASGVVALRVQGGVRRTIVALPDDRCVHVALRYAVRPFVAQIAAQLTGQVPFSGVIVFGNSLPGLSGQIGITGATAAPGPVLRIDFTSAGGSLYVRDYPASIDPELRPDWPGFRVFPERRPSTRGLRKRAAAALIAAWRVRRTQQVRSKRLTNALMPGPCSAGGAQG